MSTNLESTEESVPSSVHPEVILEWARGMEFNVGRHGGPKVHLDGSNTNGPSPFDMLLGSVAACAAVDVVAILEKMRSPVSSLRVTIDASREKATPPRLNSLILHFRIAGEGITNSQAMRAVELSVTRYCSVRSSLHENIPVSWTLRLDPICSSDSNA